MDGRDLDVIANIYGTDSASTIDVICELKNKARLPPGSGAPTANNLRRLRSQKIGNEDIGAQVTATPSDKRLVLKFSHGPSLRIGLILGKSLNCDIILPAYQDIDDYHCAINFNEAGQLVLQDLGSSAGTSVQYQHNSSAGDNPNPARCTPSQGHFRFGNVGGIYSGVTEFRKGFTWIMSGHSFLDVQDPQIIVSVGSRLKLRIDPVSYPMHMEGYFGKTQDFRQGCKESTALVGQMLQTIERQVSLASKTVQEAVTVQSHIGSGGFGTVTHHWDASSGEVYVIKEPKDGSFRSVDWTRELNAFKLCSHENIIQLLSRDSLSRDPARICLEFAPGGSLALQTVFRPLNVKESFQVLAQCLSALSYLHAHNITHRDIKPANVVVMERTQPGVIFVKLADFSLSKPGSFMDSLCGTPAWVAPEIQPGNKYGCEVDLFSLGVMVSSFLLKRGTPDMFDALLWKTDIVRAINARYFQNTCCNLFEVLCKMVQDDPSERGQAAQHLATLSRLTPDEAVLATGLDDLGLQISGRANTASQGIGGMQSRHSATTAAPISLNLAGSNVSSTPSGHTTFRE